jgi:hypothetical protein
MTPRVLLEHDRPRADGRAPRSRDRLYRLRSGYAVEWSAPFDPDPGVPTEDAEITTHYRSAEDALADWYQHPRKDERRVGRAPRGFEVARRKAREG